MKCVIKYTDEQKWVRYTTPGVWKYVQEVWYLWTGNSAEGNEGMLG